jgi:hypothetical protein
LLDHVWKGALSSMIWDKLQHVRERQARNAALHTTAVERASAEGDCK